MCECVPAVYILRNTPTFILYNLAGFVSLHFELNLHENICVTIWQQQLQQQQWQLLPRPLTDTCLASFATCAVFVGTNVAKSLTNTEIQWQLQIHLQHIITEPAHLLRVFTMKINIFVPRRVRSKYPPQLTHLSRFPLALSLVSALHQLYMTCCCIFNANAKPSNRYDCDI